MRTWMEKRKLSKGERSLGVQGVERVRGGEGNGVLEEWVRKKR